MTNPAAHGGAGCQQSKVSIIYHLLKDTAFCSHAKMSVKSILIPPVCGLVEAAPALPFARAELQAGVSQCDSRPCQDPALQEWPEPSRSIACLHWFPWAQPQWLEQSKAANLLRNGTKMGSCTEHSI